jgi:hypothetical protein
MTCFIHAAQSSDHLATGMSLVHIQGKVVRGICKNMELDLSPRLSEAWSQSIGVDYREHWVTARVDYECWWLCAGVQLNI